jgi:hypothetical protein
MSEPKPKFFNTTGVCIPQYPYMFSLIARNPDISQLCWWVGGVIDPPAAARAEVMRRHEPISEDQTALCVQLIVLRHGIGLDRNPVGPPAR